MDKAKWHYYQHMPRGTKELVISNFLVYIPWYVGFVKVLCKYTKRCQSNTPKSKEEHKTIFSQSPIPKNRTIQHIFSLCFMEKRVESHPKESSKTNGSMPVRWLSVSVQIWLVEREKYYYIMLKYWKSSNVEIIVITSNHKWATLKKFNYGKKWNTFSC